MPNRWPITSGNWSDSAIWSGSIIPTASDDVFANSQSIYIDTDIAVITLRNSATGSAIFGGSFFLNNGVNVNVSNSIIKAGSGTSLIVISQSNAASMNCPAMTLASGFGAFVVMQTSSSLNYTGSVQTTNIGGAISHGSKGILNISGSVTTNNTNGNIGISISNGGTLNIVGNAIGGTAATQRTILAQSPSCSINITGNVIGGTGNGAVAVTLGINGANGNISLTVNGNVTGNGSAGILAAFGVSNIVITGSLIDNGASAYLDTQFGAGSNLTVSGSVIGSRATGATINKTTAGGNITVIGPVYAGLSAGGIAAAAGNVFATGPFYNRNNRNAVYAPNLQLISGSTPTWTFDTETVGEQRTLYTLDYPGNFPSTTDVRDGITFGDTAQFTGTVAIPSTGSVLKGVLVDNTTGSASFTTQNVWSTPTSSLTASNSLGSRLSNTATVASDGILIALTGSL
jgi:hypothetical protein